MTSEMYGGVPATLFDAASGDLISAIAEWCACLSGQRPFRSGLQALGHALGCDAVVMSRLRTGNVDHARIVSCDLKPSTSLNAPAIGSFANDMLGEYAAKSKPGSLWFSSMFEETLSPRLTDFQRRRVLEELVIIPIAKTAKHTDFLELHFAEKRNIDQIGLLDQVCSTLLKTWSDRAAGLFADAMLSRAPDQGAVDLGVPLLDIKNPARLSRSEYRICLLISRGLNGASIQSELGISLSTLRTHLRNIYAKTETHSLAELTYLLLSHTGLSVASPEKARNLA